MCLITNINKEHEDQVAQKLREICPYGVLTNIPVFNPFSKRSPKKSLLDIIRENEVFQRLANGHEIAGTEAVKFEYNEMCYYIKLNPSIQKLYNNNKQCIHSKDNECLKKIIELHGENQSIQEWNYSYQIDALIHLDEKLIIIDAKNWSHESELTDEKIKKSIEKTKTQSIEHVKALASFFAKSVDDFLKEIECWIVVPDQYVGNVIEGEINCEDGNNQKFNIEFITKKIIGLVDGLTEKRYKKIWNSVYLSFLAKGIAIRELGHPSTPDALSYINYCREHIDECLFEEYNHNNGGGKTRISGSAGSGKTYLLAYYLYVFSSKSFIHETDAGVPNIEGKILCLCPKDKHLKSIQAIYRRILDHQHATGNIIRPEFMTFDEFHKRMDSSDGNGNNGDENENTSFLGEYKAILIDEAHDILKPVAAELFKKWNNQSNHLVIAVDRTQMFQDNPWVDFSAWNNKVLKRNYRNPPSVQWASLALLFGWFGEGHKVIPKKEEMKNIYFADSAEVIWPQSGGAYELSFRQDAHPGSFWDNTIKRFDSAHEAYEWLRPYNLSYTDVLWVRFGHEPEDSEFNYEKPYCFKPHYLPEYQSSDANEQDPSVNIINKYIKGQDFPIVVIEGNPKIFELGADLPAAIKNRQLYYMVASRATAFLIFVNTSEEVKKVVKKLSIGTQVSPHHPGKTIKLSFQENANILNLETVKFEILPKKNDQSENDDSK